MGGVTLPFANSEQALHLKNVIMWRYYQATHQECRQEGKSQVRKISNYWRRLLQMQTHWYCA